MLKPVLIPLKNNSGIDEQTLVQYSGHTKFAEDVMTLHTTLLTQGWCKSSVTNFISREERPGNSPDCIENL